MDPFAFEWGVDQDGYQIERKNAGNSRFFGPTPEFDMVTLRGGPLRYYRPLDNDGLWLRFAETCRTNEGVLQFANAYGALDCWTDLDGVLRFSGTTLAEFLNTAHRLWAIAAQLRSGDRASAAELLRLDDNPILRGLPTLRGVLLPSPKTAEGFEYKLVPISLRDALLHQAAEAISGNRRFQRCRNHECPNWFRLGPHTKSEGGKTFTARREFCSDRCRVATARRQKKGVSANA
jgi:hypothetical protein